MPEGQFSESQPCGAALVPCSEGEGFGVCCSSRSALCSLGAWNALKLHGVGVSALPRPHPAVLEREVCGAGSSLGVLRPARGAGRAAGSRTSLCSQRGIECGSRGTLRAAEQTNSARGQNGLISKLGHKQGKSFEKHERNWAKILSAQPLRHTWVNVILYCRLTARKVPQLNQMND